MKVLAYKYFAGDVRQSRGIRTSEDSATVYRRMCTNATAYPTAVPKPRLGTRAGPVGTEASKTIAGVAKCSLGRASAQNR